MLEKIFYFDNFQRKTKNNGNTLTAKMADGQGCKACSSEHDGNFYRFCKCSCHSRIARQEADNTA